MTGVINRVRPEVAAFAEAMEARLRANDHKGGWGRCDFPYLMRRLREEATELNRVMLTDENGMYDADAIVHEAADVANFAMMIADVFGNLPTIGRPINAD